jgi:hypothetical protein
MLVPPLIHRANRSNGILLDRVRPLARELEVAVPVCLSFSARKLGISTKPGPFRVMP